MTCSYVYMYVLHSSRLPIPMYVCHGSASSAAEYVYKICIHIHVTCSQTTSSWASLHNMAGNTSSIWFFLTWLLHVRDMIESIDVYFGGNNSHDLAGSDSFMYVYMRHLTYRLSSSGWLLSHTLAGRDSCIQMTWLIRISDMTRSNMIPDCVESYFGGKWYRCSFFVTKLGVLYQRKKESPMYIRDMPHSYLWHDLFIYATGLVDYLAATESVSRYWKF